MKIVVALFFLLFAPACSGPEVPSAYQVTSPASPDSAPGVRGPVADVLASSDPLEARAPVAPGVVPESNHGSHEHMNHGGHKHMNHGNHKHMNHGTEKSQ